MIDGWHERLKEAVNESGLSKRQISFAAGLGENYVTQLLRNANSRVPSIENFIKLAAALDVSPIYLIAGIHMTASTQEILTLLETLPKDSRQNIIEVAKRMEKEK